MGQEIARTEFTDEDVTRFGACLAAGTRLLRERLDGRHFGA
jgi:hypothetical protein